MGMGFAPTWLRQVSLPAPQNHFNHCLPLEPAWGLPPPDPLRFCPHPKPLSAAYAYTQRCYQDQGVRDQDQTKTRQAETKTKTSMVETETETKTREAKTKTKTNTSRVETKTTKTKTSKKWS